MRDATPNWQMRPMGPLAVLIDGVENPPAAALAIRNSGVPVVDVVPAARTVLVTVDAAADLELVADLVRRGDTIERPIVAAPTVTIDVEYDGADLDTVATAVGCSTDALIEAHSSAEYHVAFCGFAPGFAYLSGLPAALHLPRRSTPRVRVPAGSVAIASEYSAVYPTDSPGGWHLLGTTRAVMFDPHRADPALLEPGMTVRFRAT